MQFLEYQVVDSTLAEAKRLWAAKSVEPPFAVLAGEQTAGIGRRGRSWTSPPGGLWLAVAWPLRQPYANYAAAPLAAGVAVCRLMDETGVHGAEIKWPNDVLVDGRKVSGVLCQSEGIPGDGVVLLGIGVNWNLEEGLLPVDARVCATSVLAETGRMHDAGEGARTLLAELGQLLSLLEANRSSEVVDSVRERLAWLGEEVVCSDAGTGEPVRGRLVGLGDEGELQLKTEGGRRIFRSGEIETLARATVSAN